VIARPPRSDQELRTFASEHLLYELQMVGALPIEIVKRESQLVGVGGDAVLNGLLEAASHSRSPAGSRVSTSRIGAPASVDERRRST
jgi:hypothetical protein